MRHVSLKTYGKYLSGRGLVYDILNDIGLIKPTHSFAFDFNGIEIATDSFISELFLALKLKEIKCYNIKLSNVGNDTLKLKLEAHWHRYFLQSATNGARAKAENPFIFAQKQESGENSP